MQTGAPVSPCSHLSHFDRLVQEQAAKRAARAAKYGEQVDDQVLDKAIQGQKPEIVQFQVDHAKAQARRSKYGDMIEGGDMDTDGGIKEEKKSFDSGTPSPLPLFSHPLFLSPCSPDYSTNNKSCGSDVMRRTDTLHVHGTDVLSTEDIIRYFIDYSPQVSLTIPPSPLPPCLPSTDTVQHHSLLHRLLLPSSVG